MRSEKRTEDRQRLKERGGVPTGKEQKGFEVFWKSAPKTSKSGILVCNEERSEGEGGRRKHGKFTCIIGCLHFQI